MLPQQTAGVALPLPEEAGSLRATFFMIFTYLKKILGG
jgi:hypothetical protein